MPIIACLTVLCSRRSCIYQNNYEPRHCAQNFRKLSLVSLCSSRIHKYCICIFIFVRCEINGAKVTSAAMCQGRKCVTLQSCLFNQCLLLLKATHGLLTIEPHTQLPHIRLFLLLAFSAAQAQASIFLNFFFFY